MVYSSLYINKPLFTFLQQKENTHTNLLTHSVFRNNDEEHLCSDDFRLSSVGIDDYDGLGSIRQRQ